MTNKQYFWTVLALCISLAGCGSNDVTGDEQNEDNDPIGTASVDLSGAGGASYTGSASLTTVDRVWVNLLLDDEKGSIHIRSDMESPAPGNYPINQSGDANTFRAEAVLLEPTLTVFAQEGSVTLTSVSTDRIVGSFEAAGNDAGSGERIELSGSFDAVCTMDIHCP